MDGASLINQPAAPLVSVITPCLNAVHTLPATLRSVAEAAECLQRRGYGLEHWLVDGSSTDGTQSLIAEHRHHHHWCALLVGERKGPYPAMTLGLEHSCGHYAHVLNADDALLDPQAYAEALIIAYQREARFILSSIAYVQGSPPRTRSLWRVTPLPDTATQWHDQLRQGLHYPHPGFIAERLAYGQQGFDPRYRLAADYKLMQSLLLLVEPTEVLVVSHPLVAMAPGGRSGTWAGRRAGAAELRAINRELGIRAPLWQRYAGKVRQRLWQKTGSP